MRSLSFTSRALLGLLLLACGGQAKAVNLRVLITTKSQVAVSIPDGAVSSALLATAEQEALQAKNWIFSATGKRLKINGKPTGGANLYFAPIKDSWVRIAGKSYRGGVFLTATAGKVRAINVVDVEDYLRGVVSAEMPASWPSEALKAQAVIARSYAAARISTRADYDTCASESCQVYGGMAAEHPRTDSAIRATVGQVVSYQGKVAKTYFSSDSGGHTASSAEVWNMPADYLIAKPDPFSAGKKNWQLSISRRIFTKRAASYGVRVGTIKSIKVSEVGSSGRPIKITFSGSQGVRHIVGAKAGGFIRSLGAKSSLAKLSGVDPLVISGLGNGHGVGLSQYGALTMSKQGYDHFHILGFYYPKTLLSSLAGASAGLFTNKKNAFLTLMKRNPDKS